MASVPAFVAGFTVGACVAVATFAVLDHLRRRTRRQAIRAAGDALVEHLRRLAEGAAVPPSAVRQLELAQELAGAIVRIAGR